VTDGSKSAAIKAMLDLGMRVTVNSDDPAYFPGYMNENFMRAHKDADLSKAELARLAENAFASAWLPPARTQAYLAELRAYAG
jgi:adenine deaminase